MESGETNDSGPLPLLRCAGAPNELQGPRWCVEKVLDLRALAARACFPAWRAPGSAAFVP